MPSIPSTYSTLTSLDGRTPSFSKSSRHDGSGTAALTARESGAEVVLYEKNDRLGKKLRITGKGRCNVTNHCTRETFFDNVTGDARFLYSAWSRFDSAETERFFEEEGVPLKVERGNRVFPVSDKSGSVIAALQEFLKKQKVEIRKEKVEEILLRDSAVSGVRTAQGTYYGRCVILCTGGCSYPLTGSTGVDYVALKDGYSKPFGSAPDQRKLAFVKVEGMDLCPVSRVYSGGKALATGGCTYVNDQVTSAG